MRKNQTSMTAIGIAIVRGIESEKPEGQRICYDPYARQFVSPFLYKFVRFFDWIGYSEIKGPGVMGFLTVRERHIDEYLKACLKDGIRQLVILGAGLDARAYRFDELKSGDAITNAGIIKDIISGKEKGLRKDIVILNAAAAIMVGKAAKGCKEQADVSFIDTYESAIKLAEDYYSDYGIFKRLITDNFRTGIKVEEENGIYVIKIPELLEVTEDRVKLRGFSVQLLALLESRDLDYGFQDESVAIQHGLEFLELPPQIDLSSSEYSDEYEKVTVVLDYRRFATVTPEFQGQPIIYGITIPQNAPHPEEAIEFLKFLLRPTGQEILQNANQPVMSPTVDNADNLPAELRTLIGQ